MEEDISKCFKNTLEEANSEDDVENNWMFVLSEDVSCAKSDGTDTSDNHSEQGSDSGSSIVVIDSPILPVSDMHPVSADIAQQELPKYEERQTEGFDVPDNISCSSHQSNNNEFLKECSPYEEMEQPDTWDCDHEAPVQKEGFSMSIPNNQLHDDATPTNEILMKKENGNSTNPESVQHGEALLNETESAEDSQVIDGFTGLSEQQDDSLNKVNHDLVNGDNVDTCREEEAASRDKVFSELQKESDEINRVEKEPMISGMKDNVTENNANFQIIQNETPLFEQATDQIPCMTTEPPSLSSVDENTISGVESEEKAEAAVLVYVANDEKSSLQEDTAFSTQPDDQSIYSVDDDSEDETWDLSLEVLMNANSLASSLSSLVQQPSSPSPLGNEADGYQRSHPMLKPDLLEEANRIEELDLMDYSAVTNPDLPAEIAVANIVPDRHYVHHPNQRLNEKLSFVMAFALAAVVGFAIGHIIGLSDNFPSRCNYSDESTKPVGSHSYEGWTESDLLDEIKRLTSHNEELTRTLRELSGQDSTGCRFDLQLNELMSENWDLKQSIGRIRYGKPTRSVEDRDTINHLQTENQDLRATVGKLRYRCGQPLSSPQQQGQQILAPPMAFVSRPSAIEPLWKALEAMNLTGTWNHLVNYRNNRSIEDQLKRVKDSSTDLIRLMGLRREELINLTRQTRNPVTEKMEARFKKITQKTVDLMERVNKHHKSFALLLEEVDNRLEKMRFKLESQWENLLRSYTDSGNRFETLENTKPLNSDWFWSMGHHRDKLRRSEKQSEWMFDRARNRELERRARKFQAKQRKQKPFQGNSWNQYSS
ncbi:uncharacterized protein LOC130703856 isoform X2 [Daphnia carinata]|uniref:uncharacterized protein LOC130703856 isoform X2 n=1 Tax=Daphnia carinata TaxID=120202 RepID=UPI002868E51B|nr:uncharacterized protein LOC130703856 isoform X2 [Daphnia carinata]